MTNVTRPEGTYTPEYAKCRKSILRWRQDNKEHIAEYNREYQRKLRKDPVKYQELCMRVSTSAYLRGKWKNSFKVVSALGMDRKQLASKFNMTEEEFKNTLKTHELDHIISASWFNTPKTIHLKPFMYRHYNLQLLPKGSNRTKHNYVDENDVRVQLVITQLELEHANSLNFYDKESIDKINYLSNKAVKLRTQVRKKYT
jgi:hypothetical protein